MDPNALWHLLFDALQELQDNPQDESVRVVVAGILEFLASWIRAGGFPPTIG